MGIKPKKDATGLKHYAYAEETADKIACPLASFKLGTPSDQRSTPRAP